MEQLKTLGRELAMSTQSLSSSSSHSKEFLDLIKSIGESRSKSEEDRIILHEIETLKRRITDPEIPKRKMKEYIIRLLYVEMLGHDASFGYIYAVKMTHDESVAMKRTGYLAVTLFLEEDHELMILIVNTIQKDLRSDNYLVVCAALNAVCRLINEETIPAVLGQVVELVGHGKEAVRKKAVMALHRFYQKAPGLVSHLVSNFRKRLCDNDPGVMGAALCPLHDLIAIDPNPYKDLVIRLLKILALLGSGDKQASEQMYMVLGEVIKKCDTLSNIGNAVLYECVCCASAIYPNKKLLESADHAISKFLKSDKHNLKYMGIDALGRLIKISPEVAEQHQLAVIDCLEDPDDTLKRKTFELLYKMTKSSNVEVIVAHMIDYMISINDSHYKTEIASRCVELAEQFAPSNQWFIQTMNKVFEHAGDLVNVKVAHNLMHLIAEGFGDDDDAADSLLRLSAVDSYLKIIGEPKLPSAFLQVICWVLGEYGTADGKYSASYITGKLCDVAEAHSNDDRVKAYAITALLKIFAFEKARGKQIDVLPECQTLTEDLLASHSTDLQQRAYELQTVIGLDAQTVETIMPIDASCEDIEVDKGLSFLNGYVQKSLEQGAQPYIPEHERTGLPNISNFRSHDQHPASAHALRFEAYELPKAPAPKTPAIPQISSTQLVPVPEPSYTRDVFPVSTLQQSSDGGSDEIKLRLDGVKKKWGRPSYSSTAPSSSSSASQKTVNGVSSLDGMGTTSSKARDAYNSKESQVEIPPEKQRLAASLFGGTSKTEKRSLSVHKPTKAAAHATDKSNSEIVSAAVSTVPPAPNLLDLGVSDSDGAATSVDPFKQLEELLEPATNKMNAVSSENDILSLYSGSTTGNSGTSTRSKDDALLFGSSVQGSAGLPARVNKGPNTKDAVQRDALVRQMGVNPSSPNPNLFKDLLG
ncbi:AP-4 complex subunit epsilon-like protein [Drosera capensis]